MQVEINNFKMGYEEAGAGIPIVFIHGYPLDRRIWQPQLAGLAGVGHVLAPDLRGHGESDGMSGPYWMDTFADDLDAFLDEKEIDTPAIFCGLSMGGYVAMSFYRDHAPRVGGLVFAATRANAEDAGGREKRNQAIERAQKDGVGAIVEDMLPKMFSPRTYDERGDLVDWVRTVMLSTPLDTMVNDLAGMRERPDSFATLEQIEIPVLILHGEDDQIMPRSVIDEMQEHIRHARVELIPDAGHLLNLEQPEAFNQAIRDYIEELRSLGIFGQDLEGQEG